MSPARIRQLLRRNPMLADRLLVLTLTVFAVATQLMLSAPLMVEFELGEPPPTPVIVVWAAAFTVPLLWRRRFPCTVLLITAVHLPFVWASELGDVASQLALGVAVYSAAVYGRPRRAAWCFGLCWAGLSVWLVARDWGVVGPAQTIIFVPLTTAPFLLGWGLGRMTRLTRTLREYRAVLEERNAELTVEREANARRAVLEERVRIARELHDVVAHHVSLMGIQAGVAQRLFHTRPDDAQEAVAAVQTGSRQAITDLQQLLGVLRGAADPHADTDHRGPDRDGDYETSEPAPGLDQLPALLSAVRHAGLPVDFAVQGLPQPLAPALELSTYRIVQEALTNTLKHAGAARAGVTISYHPDAAVEVDIVDDGHGHQPTAEPGGRGLVGMQERVNLHGGQLEAGPLRSGGYRVHAILGLS
jgi:signal transduction histidine kinase